VGAGSALKQLTLTRVSSIGLQEGVTAEVGERSADVVARAEAAGERAVIVLDERRRPRAWVWLREVGRHDTVRLRGDEQLNTVDRRATLNDALDTMLSSSHGAAVVTGRRGEFAGVVDFEAVTAHIRATEEQVAAQQEGEDA
jgi:osmoprotectant transport system ATP-binding protein